MKNEAAMAVLADAAERLRALGMHCEIATLSLPQGTAVSLHAGDTAMSVVAAGVALEHGGTFAHSVETCDQFSKLVKQEMAEAAADMETMDDYMNAMDRENG